jgi:putative endonuclease
MNKHYWIYILHCVNNSYYTGYTTNLNKRYQSHLNGVGSKYTRSFKPTKLVQHWEIIGDKASAMKIERYIKKLSRVQKEALIISPSLLAECCDLFPNCKILNI